MHVKPAPKMLLSPVTSMSAIKGNTYLSLYGIPLQEAKGFDDASEAGAEGVTLTMSVIVNNIVKDSLSLFAAMALHYGRPSGLTMHVRPAPKTLLLPVTSMSAIKGNIASTYLSLFATMHYGVSLRGTKRFGDACKAGAEDVTLTRHLYEQDREQYCEGLSLSSQL